MNPLEAANEQLRQLMPDDWEQEPWPQAFIQLTIVAWVRAAIGCPQCGGTGRRQPCVHGQISTHGGDPDLMPCDGQDDCSAKHVQLTVLGETIWADPAKCLWWCTRSEVGYVPLDRLEDDTGCRIDDPPHADCGWQPRWDALTGGDGGD